MCESNLDYKVDQEVFMARVAEQAQLYEDMVNFMTQALSLKGADISSDERNLCSVAFKNLIAAKRSACRQITTLLQNSKYARYKTQLFKYRQSIQMQLVADCQRIINIVRSFVLTRRWCQGEAKAFFTKIIGDYSRYIAEITQDEKAKQEALKAYTEAGLVALGPCNSIRLGLALNLSVFYYEVVKDPCKAIDVADKALADAIGGVDELDEEDFKEAKGIIDLLKENLTLWKQGDCETDF